jgi:hypothetical protein
MYTIQHATQEPQEVNSTGNNTRGAGGAGENGTGWLAHLELPASDPVRQLLDGVDDLGV